ncbi:hypothetical protein COHA_003688 [Chlorella ohadii]|uniref:Phosphoglycerate mutase n=1 Tax=Chlorella ohadii TaxID=2649997 RepID=A0AAD5H357_9CHLO|nr:hypothetical protein COHA_003688 [Chlorella ohadii]
MLRILLVRHGQCDMNLTVDQRIGGRTNHSPLTPLGERQAQALGAHLRAALAHAGVQPQRCAFFSSTAVRAVDTARLVMQALDVPTDKLTSSEQLLELDQGQWEGAVRRECFTPELTAAFAADPWRQVEQRMTQYLVQQVLPHARPDAPAIVVSHGMAIKSFMRGVLHSLPTMSRNIALANTSVTEVGFIPAKHSSSGTSNGGAGNSGGQAAIVDSSREPAADGRPSNGSMAGGSWHVLRINDTAHLPFDLECAHLSV